MGDVTRRGFVGSTAMLAAGAAVGISASKGILRHGPVELRMNLLGRFNIAFQVILSSNDRRDIFSIHILQGDMLGAWAEMRLSTVRELVASYPYFGGVCAITTCDMDGTIETKQIMARAKAGHLMFFLGERGDETSPFWVPLADVQRVL